jgi:predicted chitinase
MAPAPTAQWTLTLTEPERAELLRVLEAALRETHVERRRTEAPDYRAQVIHEEELLRGLTEKVRHLRP